MRALIADDDHVSALVVARAVERRWQVPVEVVHDGDSAWAALNAGTPPSLAIVDWMMPGVDGLELCRRIRKSPACAQMYVILLTARDSRADIVAGLEAGADDYLVKPFDSAELGARVQAGIRILSLQSQLNARIGELQQTLAAVRQLKGLLPICCYCKRIRKDEDYWQQLETYISDHSDAEFSHGICPECLVNARVEFEA
jgi:DNA-binding response OmpR family regulator